MPRASATGASETFMRVFVAEGEENRRRCDSEAGVVAFIEAHPRVLGVFPAPDEAGGYGIQAIKGAEGSHVRGEQIACLMCRDLLECMCLMVQHGDLAEETVGFASRMYRQGASTADIAVMIMNGILHGIQATAEADR